MIELRLLKQFDSVLSVVCKFHLIIFKEYFSCLLKCKLIIFICNTYPLFCLFQRPSQSFAATVCQVLLHGSPDISQYSSSKDVRNNVLEWMFMMAAETYLEASLKNSEVKTVELELRHTFCSRIQYLEVLEAVKYIAQP